MNRETEVPLCLLRQAEKQAVQGMLLTALQHGFQLSDLLLLAKQYDARAALLEYRGGGCVVRYVTAQGYAQQNFGLREQEAVDFVEQFDVWWYQ
ncbi:hypothetical protein RHD99_13465 [Buttiauxella selenatireducens]|uniref:Uncharacterized protein n=1 Tax=Buttiauxella selenatireducens TaxID=3073902 RepID=A0ABY9S4R8_9ENTR|nr:hypothetical protein [Buttiauxella sp. R73]WMY72494.1 hypothetical protein RHD99_13465 [Buttiauxella sp. R73]